MGESEFSYVFLIILWNMCTCMSANASTYVQTYIVICVQMYGGVFMRVHVYTNIHTDVHTCICRDCSNIMSNDGEWHGSYMKHNRPIETWCCNIKFKARDRVLTHEGYSTTFFCHSHFPLDPMLLCQCVLLWQDSFQLNHISNYSAELGSHHIFDVLVRFKK